MLEAGQASISRQALRETPGWSERVCVLFGGGAGGGQKVVSVSVSFLRAIFFSQTHTVGCITQL